MSVDLGTRERESVIEELASRDEELRRLAVERILCLPVSEAIPHLIESLGDSSWRVRKSSVGRLQACDQPDAVADALIAALWDGENPGRRNSAVEALIGIGSPVVDRLITALDADDVDVRKLLVDAIGAVCDPVAIPAMIRTLSDPDVNVRASAADALGSLGDKSAEPELCSSAVDESEDRLVRLSSLRALVNLDATMSVADLVGVLEDPFLAGAGYAVLGNDDDDDEAAACLLKGLMARSQASREAAMESLLRVLSRRDDADFDDLTGKIRNVGFSEPELVESWIDRLSSADLSTRLVLIQFLGLVGAPEGVVAILEASGDEAVAEVALSTLAQMGEVSETAIDRAWDVIDPGLRASACRVLSQTFGPRAVERLLEALDSDDANQRMVAAEALGRHGCERALVRFVERLVIAANGDAFEAEEECAVLTAALVAVCEPKNGATLKTVERAVCLISELLDDASSQTRLAVAVVMGRIGRREDMEVVNILMKDSDARVRSAAVEATTRLPLDVNIESLRLSLADESYRVRIAGLNALAVSGAENLRSDFERLAGDEDWRVRAATLRVIGTHEDVALTYPEKVALLQTGLDGDGAVCVAALESLTRVGGEGAVQLAVSVFDRPDPELVHAALGCLAAHGTEEELLELLPLVAHESWAVRAEVIDVLAARRVTRALPTILRRLEAERDSFVRDSILQGLKRLEA
jgi:HEAT repeat protein